MTHDRLQQVAWRFL